MAPLGVFLGPILLGAVLVVSPDGPYRSIPEALSAARDGDTIEVRPGSYPGPLVVDRSVTMVGVGRPVLDGGGQGTVVTITASGAVLRGFVIRSSGADLNGGDAGVEVKASGVVVEDNVLEDVLFGISLDNAPGSIVRGNSIGGKDLPEPRRGDGIRLWYSSDVVVEGNRVNATRDCVVWYSANLRFVGNLIEGGRYGLHFMYDDGAQVVGNVLRGNSVGVYMMYSRRVALHGNTLASNRGPSGFGLGLKDMDDLVAENNWVIDNRVGVWMDNSPRSMDSENRFYGNTFAFNDVGVAMLPAVERNIFWRNTFQENLQQMSVQGGGTPRGNRWVESGHGNYWSDYRGFDADGDGVGDVPYRAEALVGEMMDRRPELRLFQFSLAADAVEFAARAFPTLRPAPKLVDEAPLMSPPHTEAPLGAPPGDPRPAASAALGLLALAGSVLAVGRTRPGSRSTPENIRPRRTAVPVLEASRLTRRFGRVVAVDNLEFQVAPGEVVALWGPNGAGKTTAIKCILGLLPCQGRVMVWGRDALVNGKEARRSIGYVPQEVAFHDDLTVQETATFYSRLRRASPGRADELLRLLDLAEHAHKPVGALSGGMRQRLAIALALLSDPPLLVLDEPTSNLDAEGREQVLRLLGGLRRRGTAILLASHRVGEVEALADRVLVLEQGRVAFVCSPHELVHHLNLRLGMKLYVAGDRRDDALAVLRAGGLAPSPNGAAIRLEVLPTQKVLPIRLLERAGIAVVDFVVEDRGGEAGWEGPWTR